MDRGKHEPPFWRSVWAEVFGTFVLVLVDTGGATIEALDPSGEVTPVGRSIATGLTIMALIYALGSSSGAHFNPAVTTAFTLRGVFRLRRAVFYVLAQLAGAIAAALILRVMLGNVGHLGANEPKHGALTGLMTEVLLTLILVTVILSTATRHRVIGTDAAIAVGGTIAFCGLFSRPLSGASMNPARSLGPALVSGSLEDVWIYILGPLAGAVLAVLVVALLHGAPKAEEEEAAAGDSDEQRDTKG